jgi:GTPase
MTEMLLLIENMFKVKDRGYAACGDVASSPICVGDRVLVLLPDDHLHFVISDIQSCLGWSVTRVERVEVGSHTCVLLEGEGAELLQRGHVLCRDVWSV